MSALTWKEIEQKLLAVADVIEKESNGKWMKES